MADANNNLPQPLHNAAGSLAPQRPTEFAGILRLLSTLSYQDREQISAYERQVYDMLRSSPQNLDGLVAFLRIQLMQGNHQKAKLSPTGFGKSAELWIMKLKKVMSTICLILVWSKWPRFFCGLILKK